MGPSSRLSRLIAKILTAPTFGGSPGGGRVTEVDTENDREPDQPHGHLSAGWLARSLADEGCWQALAALVEHGYSIS